MSDRVYVMCDGKLRGEITEKEEHDPGESNELRDAVLMMGGAKTWDKKKLSFKDIMVNYGVIIIMSSACYLHGLLHQKISCPVITLTTF